jgi:hypothetical protein
LSCRVSRKACDWSLTTLLAFQAARGISKMAAAQALIDVKEYFSVSRMLSCTG